MPPLTPRWRCISIRSRLTEPRRVTREDDAAILDIDPWARCAERKGRRFDLGLPIDLGLPKDLAFRVDEMVPMPHDQGTTPMREELTVALGLGDTNEVARWVAKRAVAHAPRLRHRLLNYLGTRRADLFEGCV